MPRPCRKGLRTEQGQQARLASDLLSLEGIFISPNLTNANYTVKGGPNTMIQISLGTIGPPLASKHRVKC